MISAWSGSHNEDTRAWDFYYTQFSDDAAEFPCAGRVCYTADTWIPLWEIISTECKNVDDWKNIYVRQNNLYYSIPVYK